MIRKGIIVLLATAAAGTLILGAVGMFTALSMGLPRQPPYDIGERFYGVNFVNGSFQLWRFTVIDKPLLTRTTHWSLDPGWRYAAMWRDTSGLTVSDGRRKSGVHMRGDRIAVGVLIPLVLFGTYPTVCFIRGPLRRRRWRRKGRCVFCGYDLTANESGVCPECGALL